MSGERTERRLTTILAADVVGYSRLMGNDEWGTLAALQRHRKQLIEPKARQYRGRTVKLMGDGILMEFVSVVDAVLFAVEVQCAMKQRNASVPEAAQIVLRIGINIGDIIAEDDDIYGDGVNVAARLEQLAEPGGICVRRSVRNQVRDKVELDFHDLGEIDVKNISRPIRVFAVALDERAAAMVTPVSRTVDNSTIIRPHFAIVLLVIAMFAGSAFWWWPLFSQNVTSSGFHDTVPKTDKPSLAVLPFSNLSNDEEQEYFADGITDDLITDLSRVSGLFVIARNSSFSYKAKSAKLQQIAKELGARYLLEGSVRRSNDQVRINAQLIDAETGGHVWAGRFDRKIEDVFALQDDVVGRIVSALSVTLTPDERTNLDTSVKVDPEAYDLFLRANSRFLFFDASANAEALDLFKKAVALDPSFARAHAGVALAHALAVTFNWTQSPDKDSEEAMRYAQTALALDDSIPVVYFSRGAIYSAQKRFEEAIAELRQAVTIDPNYADGHVVLGQYLNFAGRPEEGMKWIEKAMRLSPHHGFVYLHIKATGHFAMEQYDEAIALLVEVLKRNPAFLASRLLLISCYGQLNRTEDAKWEVEELLATAPNFSLTSETRRVRFNRPEDLERYVTGLRKAGLPD